MWQAGWVADQMKAKVSACAHREDKTAGDLANKAPCGKIGERAVRQELERALMDGVRT